ncbi:hypothetical protein ACFWVF_13465 [Streptomyces sp. NPDC058659]|uniref:hypothetical protein n=1 Tax=unclassified Streptomyces TaxID=2593676 RepID=UPI0036491DC5
MDLSFYKSWLSEELRAEGGTDGCARRRRHLLVLEQRGLDVPDDVRERVTARLDGLGSLFVARVNGRVAACVSD